MSNVSRGNGKENKTARLLEDEGWCVGSRRHIPGPGDLLAVKPGERPRLIEVKARIEVWQGFRRADRDEMLAYAAKHGLVAEVAWWKPRAREPIWLDQTTWP